MPEIVNAYISHASGLLRHTDDEPVFGIKSFVVFVDDSYYCWTVHIHVHIILSFADIDNSTAVPI